MADVSGSVAVSESDRERARQEHNAQVAERLAAEQAGGNGQDGRVESSAAGMQDRGGSAHDTFGKDLSAIEIQYLRTIGARLLSRVECGCPVCGHSEVAGLKVLLPTGRHISLERCGYCQTVHFEEEAEQFEDGQAGTMADFLVRLRDIAKDARNQAANKRFGLLDAYEFFTVRLNSELKERGLPISRAARDAILAAALGTPFEDYAGRRDDSQD